ncbi:hypothetical protein MCOR28_002278 [Pyricularia oryzae]|nr:hypothetical protein MCOR01_011452 [Pyricularia oryzae]KAI6262620.1 hypothetical protein MCOR19_001129 [Pyricularia oryzae]KAI6278395.1 hypothetical protein MCOR26_004669 [Pyricularia oryzae]KAI6347419.1 hypothetical protein MCOR28_002278 [Pyricularia oryzae]KAI6413031.1 hypothetical protein MCOR20_003142 [Pyricularia oryzae]
MNLHHLQGRAAPAGPKLRGTPLKLRRDLRRAQAERDKKLDDIERDSRANVLYRPKTQHSRGQTQDARRRDWTSMNLELPSRPRQSAGKHVDVQGQHGQRQERLEIRLEPTSPDDRIRQRQRAPRAPVTPPPRRSPRTRSSPQHSEPSNESASDDSSSDDSSPSDTGSDDSGSDDEPSLCKRKARPRVKLSKRQQRDLLMEFVVGENDFPGALANGAKCHRDMPFWINIRKRLRLDQVTNKWSDLSRAFGVIVGTRERQAMAGKKVPCNSDIERLIDSCARIRIRRGILDGFVDDKLLNPNMVPGLIESGSLEQCELILGEMQYLQRKQRNKEVPDGPDNADEESDAQDDSELQDSNDSSDSSCDSSSSDDSNDTNDINDDDGESTSGVSDAAHQTASSPPTSAIMASPRWPHADQASSPSSTTAATYHADTDYADNGDDEDDSSAIEEAIALLQRRQERKRRRAESGADEAPSRRVRMQHENDAMRTRGRDGADELLGRWAGVI